MRKYWYIYIPTINVLFENGLVENKLLSLPPIIAAVGAYIVIFEPNLIGVTSSLLYIYSSSSQ